MCGTFLDILTQWYRQPAIWQDRNAGLPRTHYHKTRLLGNRAKMDAETRVVRKRSPTEIASSVGINSWR